MHIDRTSETARRLNLRLTATAAMLAGSVATNLVLGLLVMEARQTVLVPMLPANVALSNTGGVSGDYLEAAARDAAYLFLNRSPDNQDYFEQQLLKIADPATYQAIRASLSDMRRKSMTGHVSQSFTPTDWYVEPKKLYVEAAGELTTTNGTAPPETLDKIYAIRFLRHGSSLRLGSFEEIKREVSMGSKVQITPPPAPKPIPVSVEGPN